MTDADLRPVPEAPTRFSILANLVPAGHLLLTTIAVFALADGAAARLGLALASLYLAPPLAVRAAFAVFGRPEGRLTQATPGYRVWWLAVQAQMIFLRLPALEEVLRLVPMLYPAWIALWGGRLSPRAFVAPGVRIVDRPYVVVEAGAVIGLGATLTGHLAFREADGTYAVIVAAPRVERDALLGAETGLGPGAVVRRGAMLPFGRRLGPGMEWPRRADGRGEGGP